MIVSDDHAYWEPIANHPRVFEKIALPGMEVIDTAAYWGSSLGLQFPGGGFVITRLSEGVWTVHALFVPGNWHVRRCASEVLRYLFTQTDCVELVATPPADLPHSIKLALDMEMTHRRTLLDAYPRAGGNVAVHILSLTKTDWGKL